MCVFNSLENLFYRWALRAAWVPVNTIMELLKPFQLFDQSQCNHIMESVSDFSQGRTAGPDPHRSVRNNHVSWLKLDPIMKDLLWETARPLAAEWLWHWFEEPVQISRYSPGQHYDWHSDVYNHNRSSQRVLTLTCTLQVAEAAQFETESGNFDLAQGQAVFFPSVLRHRATAPTSGQRWALTVWYMAANHR